MLIKKDIVFSMKYTFTKTKKKHTTVTKYLKIVNVAWSLSIV